MKKKNIKKETQSSSFHLDTTSNDFQEEQVFRVPKRSQVENGKDKITKAKGRPRRSAKAPMDTRKASREKEMGKLSRNSQSSSLIQRIKDPPEVSENCSFPLHSHGVPTAVPSIMEDENPFGDASARKFSYDAVASKADDEDETDDLAELEKSVCSSSEKLCPSCKHIVFLAEYPDHFTKCLQKFSFSRNGTKVEGNADNATVLPCPVCLKPLALGTERLPHMKSCGSIHGLSAEQLILATRLQKKQSEERVVLGLPTPQLGPDTSEAKQRKGAITRTKATLDPDMQLAFALSRSLAEEERERRAQKEDRLVSLGLEDVLQEERRTLVLPQPPPLLAASHKGPRGPRGRKKALVRTALMTRTKEKRERIITEKVAALLVDEVTGTCTSSAGKPRLRRPLGPLDQYYDQESSLWNFVATGTEVPIESHYVSELEEFIKPQSIPVGELLKSFSKVPGRLDYTVLAEDSAEEQNLEENEDLEEDSIEATIVDDYCTQLALAEMLGTQEMADLSLDAEEDPDTDIKDTDAIAAQFDTNDEDQKARVEGESEIGDDEGRKLMGRVKGDEGIGDSHGNVKNDGPSALDKVEFTGIACGGRVPNILKEDGTEDASASHFFPDPPSRASPLPHDPATPASSLPSDTPNPAYPLSPDPSAPASPLHTKLIYDWSSLLASGDRSDVYIVTAEAEIPVHSLVLSVRCPDILREIEQTPCRIPTGKNDRSESEMCRYLLSINASRRICWSSVAYEAAYSFMVYLYSGVCTVKSKENDMWMDLFDLSIKYQCHELVAHLENVYKTSSEENVHSEERQSGSHENSLTEGLKRENVNLQSESEGFHDCIPDEPNKKEASRVDSTIKEDLNATQIVSPEPKSHLDTSPNSKLPYHATPTSADLNSKEVPSTHLESPDIFGDWCDVENPETSLETPVVGTLPGNRFTRCISAEVINTPISNFTGVLNASEKDLRPRDEKDADGRDDSILILSESIENKTKDHRHRTASESALKRNLSKDFKDLSSPYTDREENNASSLLVVAERDKESSEHPVLPHSPFSDFSYPSGNEVVDLTLTSDDSVDSHLETNVPPSKSFHTTPKKAGWTVHTSRAEQRHPRGWLQRDKDEELLFGSSLLRKDEGVCPPSNLFSLVDKPISSIHRESYKPRDANVLSPTRFVGAKDSAVSSSPVKDYSSSSKEENRVRHCLTFSKLSGIKSKGSDRSARAQNETQSSSFQGWSDDSLLKAVCEAEEKLAPGHVRDPVRRLLPKSKSLMDHGSRCSKSFITPDKIRAIGESPAAASKEFFAITPLPDYQSMVSPQLQKELDKFGIRKLSRKKAIKLLVHIYEQMHPFVSDSEPETSFSNDPPHCDLVRVPSRGVSKTKGRPTVAATADLKQSKLSENDVEDEEGGPLDVLNSSQSTVTSRDSNFECLEEAAFPDPQDDTITPSQQTSLETRLRSFIKNDAELHTKILLYEPIWVSELQQNLKANGIKCSMAKLIKFLDEQCITFRLPRKERTKRRKHSPNKGRSSKLLKKS